MTGIECSICGKLDASQSTKNAIYCSDCYQRYFLNRKR